MLPKIKPAPHIPDEYDRTTELEKEYTDRQVMQALGYTINSIVTMWDGKVYKAKRGTK